MHKTNIENISSNVAQLLLVQHGILSSLRGSELLQKQDESILTKNINTIINEQQKVDQLEMTLAVVGTMKSGKSTTINAIVGQEIMPNRTRPMTTLPTLIRHKPGQHQPVLYFRHNQPALDLMGDIKQKLQQSECSDFLFSNIETERLAEEILSPIMPELKSEYVGRDEIFDFLQRLNDIFRLAGELQIQPPYSEYEKLTELPVVEVEFHHLMSTGESLGTLSILDTPGPNEFGQNQELRQVYRTQLKQASGVVLVMDYTQLGSDSEAEVREEVMQLRDVLANRLHVVVNKFDNANRNSMDRKTTQEYVAERMLGNGFSPSDVYPVSSNYAFLANYTLCRIQYDEELSVEDPIVEDFSRGAFGRKWEERLKDLSEVAAEAESLWGESEFQRPLDSVIAESYQRAAFEALISALDKTAGCSGEYQNLLSARGQAIQTEVSKLKFLIDDLRGDVESIQKVKQGIDAIVHSKLQEAVGLLTEFQSQALNNLNVAIESLFQEGKTEEKKRAKEKQDSKSEPVRKGFHNIMYTMLLEKKPRRVTPLDFDPDSPVIEFDTSKDASSYLRKVEKKILKPFKSYEQSIEDLARTTPLAVASEVQAEILHSCKQVLDKASEVLKEGGFTLDFQLRSCSFEGLSVNVDKVFDDNLQEGTKKDYWLVQKEGAWNSVKGWFGKEEYRREYYDVDVYKVDMESLRKKIKEEVKDIKKKSLKVNKEYMVGVVRPELETQVNEVCEYFERFRAELQRGIEVQKLSQEEQKKVKKQIAEFGRKFHEHKLDVSDAQSEVKSLDKENKAVSEEEFV